MQNSKRRERIPPGKPGTVTEIPAKCAGNRGLSRFAIHLKTGGAEGAQGGWHA
jgi:hypothetical protein